MYSDTTFPSSAFGSLSKGKYSNSFVFALSLPSVFFSSVVSLASTASLFSVASTCFLFSELHPTKDP